VLSTERTEKAELKKKQALVVNRNLSQDKSKKHS